MQRNLSFLRINPGQYFHVDFILKLPIKKCWFDVHLMDVPLAEKCPKCLMSSNRCKYFIEVHTRYLWEALCNWSCTAQSVHFHPASSSTPTYIPQLLSCWFVYCAEETLPNELFKFLSTSSLAVHGILIAGGVGHGECWIFWLIKAPRWFLMWIGCGRKTGIIIPDWNILSLLTGEVG